MLTYKRNWLFGGYTAQYETTLSLPLGALSTLVDGFLRHVRKSLNESSESKKLTDHKGRNPPDRLMLDMPEPTKDEIFRFTGEIATEPAGDDFEWSPFEVHECSIFDSFEGAHHIIQRLEENRLGSIPTWVPTQLLGQLIPVKPQSFRFGIEHFRSSLVSATFGYTPTVAESFLVDANEKSLAIRLVVEERSKSLVDPFAALPFLKASAEIIQRSSGHDIAQEYLTLLRSHLQ